MLRADEPAAWRDALAPLRALGDPRAELVELALALAAEPRRAELSARRREVGDVILRGWGVADAVEGQWRGGAGRARLRAFGARFVEGRDEDCGSYGMAMSLRWLRGT